MSKSKSKSLFKEDPSLAVLDNATRKILVSEGYTPEKIQKLHEVKLTKEEQLVALELIIEDGLNREPLIHREYVLEKLRMVRGDRLNPHILIKEAVLNIMRLKDEE